MEKAKSFKFKWKLFLAGIVSIVLGFVLLATSEISASPILLVLGYCVLIPLSFL
jgi:uncharacterized membrane protein HdeD (DUF308 family)